MTKDERTKLIAIFGALENAIGDTDPYIPEDMTDEEIAEDEPVFWAAQQISELLMESEKTGIACCNSATEDTPQVMTFAEREHLKNCFFEKEGHMVIRMITHWHRQRKPIPFSEYAANWAIARNPNDVPKMLEAFPHSGKRMIADNKSDWEFSE